MTNPSIIVQAQSCFPEASTIEGRKISNKFTAQAQTNQYVESYNWYLKYSSDNNFTNSSIKKIGTTILDSINQLLTADLVPYNSAYKIGVSVSNGQSTSSIIYESDYHYFYSDIKSVSFPSLVIKDFQDNYTPVANNYFRKKITASWNENNTFSQYKFLDKDDLVLSDINSKLLYYEVKDIDWKTALPKLPYLHYEIYYFKNGDLINEPIQKGIITEKSKKDFIFDFTEKASDNDEISFQLVLYDVEDSSKQIVRIYDGKTLKKASRPQISPIDGVTVSFAYKNISPIRPFSDNGEIAFTLGLSKPMLYNSSLARNFIYKIRLRNEKSEYVLHLGKYTEENFSDSAIKINIPYDDILKQNISKELTNSGNINLINKNYKKEKLYLEIIDSYGLSNSYLITNVDINYQEAPKFLASNFQIGIDYIGPNVENLTLKDNIVNPQTTKNNRLINEGEYLIFSCPNTTDKNNDKVYYEAELLSSNDPNGIYIKVNMPLSFWSNSVSENEEIFGKKVSALILSNKYSFTNKNLKCGYILLDNITKRQYYKLRLKAFNIDETDHNLRVYDESIGSIESDTYLIGCPIRLPELKIDSSSVPKIIQEGSTIYANTNRQNSSTEQIYTTTFSKDYFLFPNLERSLNYTYKNIVSSYTPKAYLTLQYSLDGIFNNSIESKPAPINSPFSNEKLSKVTLTKALKNVLDENGKMKKIFFRIKLTITSGLKYETSSTKIIDREFTTYSNVVIYYPSGPTISARYHSIGINEPHLLNNEVITISPYGGKTYINFKGASNNGGQRKEASFAINLDNNQLLRESTNNEIDYNFIISNEDIDILFK